MLLHIKYWTLLFCFLVCLLQLGWCCDIPNCHPEFCYENGPGTFICIQCHQPYQISHDYQRCLSCAILNAACVTCSDTDEDFTPDVCRGCKYPGYELAQDGTCELNTMCVAPCIRCTDTNDDGMGDVCTACEYNHAVNGDRTGCYYTGPCENSNCLACPDGRDNCKSCRAGYYGSKCTQCLQFCSQCFGSEDCERCFPYFGLSNGRRSCIGCSVLSDKCLNCKDTNFDNTADECLLCGDGYQVTSDGQGCEIMPTGATTAGQTTVTTVIPRVTITEGTTTSKQTTRPTRSTPSTTTASTTTIQGQTTTTTATTTPTSTTTPTTTTTSATTSTTTPSSTTQSTTTTTAPNPNPTTTTTTGSSSTTTTTTAPTTSTTTATTTTTTGSTTSTASTSASTTSTSTTTTTPSPQQPQGGTTESTTADQSITYSTTQSSNAESTSVNSSTNGNESIKVTTPESVTNNSNISNNSTMHTPVNNDTDSSNDTITDPGNNLTTTIGSTTQGSTIGTTYSKTQSPLTTTTKAVDNESGNKCYSCSNSSVSDCSQGNIESAEITTCTQKDACWTLLVENPDGVKVLRTCSYTGDKCTEDNKNMNCRDITNLRLCIQCCEGNLCNYDNADRWLQEIKLGASMSKAAAIIGQSIFHRLNETIFLGYILFPLVSYLSYLAFTI